LPVCQEPDRKIVMIFADLILPEPAVSWIANRGYFLRYGRFATALPPWRWMTLDFAPLRPFVGIVVTVGLTSALTPRGPEIRIFLRSTL
jgi:hypothetical protein